MRIRFPLLITTFLLLSIAGTDLRLSAQGERGRGKREAPPARSPREAMRHFLRSLRGESAADPSAFFPREGDWTWVHTVHLYTGEDVVGTWRFRGAETEGAIYGCGPARDSFYASYEGQPPGITLEAMMRRGSWRQAGRLRFVPAYRPASSPVFVQWRREKGRWVIASFGDESDRGPRVAGTVVGDVMRTRRMPEPARPAYAAEEPWLVRHDALFFEAHRYVQYSVPRTLEPGELEQIGWRGDIRVYVEKGHAREVAPAVLYVPVAAGSYQPYIDYAPDECPGPDPSEPPR